MFTTIDTEYLDELHEGKKLLNSLTIKPEHLQLISSSLVKARTKHPKFCDVLTEGDKNYYEQLEDFIKNKNDNKDKAERTSADMILKEEIAEMFHAFTSGEKQKAKEEAADCIAVLVRIMEELDK